MGIDDRERFRVCRHKGNSGEHGEGGKTSRLTYR